MYFEESKYLKCDIYFKKDVQKNYTCMIMRIVKKNDNLKS